MIIVFLLWWMLKHDPLDPFVHLLAPGGCFPSQWQLYCWANASH